MLHSLGVAGHGMAWHGDASIGGDMNSSFALRRPKFAAAFRLI
jgi:hypothetical protein